MGNKTPNHMNNRGSTLIEILVAITILSILVIIAIPRLSGFTDRARRTSDQQTVAIIANGIAGACQTGRSFGAPDKLDIGRYTVTQTVNGEVSPPSNELIKNKFLLILNSKM